jgi:hypothetical protein
MMLCSQVVQVRGRGSGLVKLRRRRIGAGAVAADSAVIASNRPDRHVVTGRQLRVMLADGGTVDISPGGHDADYLRRELPRALPFLVTGQL